MECFLTLVDQPGIISFNFLILSVLTCIIDLKPKQPEMYKDMLSLVLTCKSHAMELLTKTKQQIPKVDYIHERILLQLAKATISNTHASDVINALHPGSLLQF